MPTTAIVRLVPAVFPGTGDVFCEAKPRERRHKGRSADRRGCGPRFLANRHYNRAICCTSGNEPPRSTNAVVRATRWGGPVFQR